MDTLKIAVSNDVYQSMMKAMDPASTSRAEVGSVTVCGAPEGDFTLTPQQWAMALLFESVLDRNSKKKPYPLAFLDIMQTISRVDLG